MEMFTGFIVGLLLMYLILQKPLKIEIKSTVETAKPQFTHEDYDELEAKMLEDDPKKDALYDKLDEALVEVSNVMGGSDR